MSRTNVEFAYCHVLSCTGMYQYVPGCTDLPDPVQVYRIPDGSVLGPDRLPPVWPEGRAGRRTGTGIPSPSRNVLVT